jgi:hypothetical protein
MKPFRVHGYTWHFVRQVTLDWQEFESSCLRCFSTVARQDLHRIVVQEQQHDCFVKCPVKEEASS